MDFVVWLRYAQMAAERGNQCIVGGLDMAVHLLPPDAGGFQHFAEVQFHALLYQVALLEWLHKTAHQVIQCPFQGMGGVVNLVGRYRGVVTGVGEHGLVQAGLVAKVVADGGNVDLRRQRNLAGGGLGKTLLCKQGQCCIQQAVARVDAVTAQGLD